MENQGWVLNWRQMEGWEWYAIPNMAHLFQHLIRKANHQDNRWQGISVKRGQLITSLQSLKLQTGISIRSLRTCLARLKETEEISEKTTSRYRVITINNYDTYQTDRQAGDKQTTNKRQTNDKRPTTNNNDKNVKNDNKRKYNDSFEDFWEAFIGRWNVEKGRHDKGGKMEAFEEWEKLTEQQQAKAMKAAPLTGSKITKDACRWLKYQRWEDFEDAAPKEQTAARQKALERKRQVVREDYEQYYRERTTEELRAMLKEQEHHNRRWLINEILTEKGK